MAKISEDSPPAIPHAPAIEKNLIGLALSAPGEVLAKLMAAGVSEATFYTPAHRIIFRHLRHFLDEGRAIDITLLAQTLQTCGELEAVGGLPGLADIQAAGGEIYMLDAYAAELKKIEQARRVQMAILRLWQKSQNGVCSVEEIEGELEKLQASAAAPGETACRIVPLQKIMGGVINKLEKQIKAKTHIAGARTGFHELDELLGGLREGGGFYLLAARPGEGKTAIALNIARAVAEGGEPTGGRVLFVSAEMSPEALGSRLLCAYSGYSWRDMCKGGLNKGMFARVLKISKLISAARLDIMQVRGSVEGCAAAVKREARRQDLKLVIVDYAQLFTSEKAKAGNRVEDLEQVSGVFRALANALPCPLLLLAQVNRAADKAADKRPSMADLKGSGAFEQDAEAVILLHRPEAHAKSKDEREKLKGQAELIIAKNRNGDTGIIPLVWQGTTQTFSDTPAPAE